MAEEKQSLVWSELIEKIRTRTPARILVDGSGPAYLTTTQLELRRAHASARDAVRDELNIIRDLGEDFVRESKLFEISTLATSKDEYLLRPDLGRRLNDAARDALARCPLNADLQIVIGDGLSVTAVSAHVPRLLPKIVAGARDRGWKIGQPFVIRHCRVGVMNEIGELLNPKVLVLLIGERPGLATAESLSAYMAYCPRSGHTDANRNLLSNIHAAGVGLDEAARRIIALAERFWTVGRSGVGVTEVLEAPPALGSGSEQL